MTTSTVQSNPNIVRYVLFFICITMLLTSDFYQNKWEVVDQDEYVQWQRGWESLIIARLVKSRQDGIFSAGGLTGIGDVTEWDLGNRTINHQYEMYEHGGEFEIYLPYKSFPGFQGFIFSSFDALTAFSPGLTIKLFRGMFAVLNSITIALLLVGLSIEFGWGTSVFVFLFTALSKWFILPAGSIYWSLWSFYLSPILIMFYMALIAGRDTYPDTKLYWLIFIATLIKILFSGFEFITTQLVMSTIPFVYFAVRDNWEWSVFFLHIRQVMGWLLGSTFTGLMILGVQISCLEGSFSSAIWHIVNTINRRSVGNSEILPSVYHESKQAGLFSVIWNYLNIPAVSISRFGWDFQITFLHLIILFFIFTGFFLLISNVMAISPFYKKGRALMVSVWCSILAPLSWLIIFKPHAYLHTFLDPIIWQMPFTIIGLAFCGFVLFNSARILWPMQMR